MQGCLPRRPFGRMVALSDWPVSPNAKKGRKGPVSALRARVKLLRRFPTSACRRWRAALLKSKRLARSPAFSPHLQSLHQLSCFAPASARLDPFSAATPFAPLIFLVPSRCPHRPPPSPSRLHLFVVQCQGLPSSDQASSQASLGCDPSLRSFTEIYNSSIIN